MATPAPAFELDPGLWNQTLYGKMREFWFGNIPAGSETPPMEQMKKWFGIAQSPEVKKEMDSQCKAMAEPALNSITPEHLTLPAFKKYEDEQAQAETLAAPFLHEVETARQQGEEMASQTLLSVILLLDQMPRNILREQHELPLVYNHYDRLAYALVMGSLEKTPELFTHPSVQNRMYWMWLLMPLTHSEHLPSHRRLYELGEQFAKNANEPKEGAVADYARSWFKAYGQHYEPIEKFGRFPHRNQCLGRMTTLEETKYLQTADTFGVEQKEAKQTKDEL
ncbi:hypothetical protein LTR78_002210 [Recurvomyces mirabilis]|uniref:DUF924-domain-containing protein n=1 Tax=Recurvomyces mirabilis TaxID=574656 RepID=A0AAE0WTY8_9PEZI|nr:hypothetical protein LTR78_002210 [Recurvomyces mirabilis]KAK5160666.1 hypothetical protein LTS14_001678 [Recurvomyces mirabilis]